MIACTLHNLQGGLLYEARGTEQELRFRSAFPQMFFRQQGANEGTDYKFRIFSNDALRTLNHYRNKRLSPISRDLINSKANRLSVSDEGGASAVTPDQLHVAITGEHVTDVALYWPSFAKEYKSRYRTLKKQWVKVAKAAV